MQRVKVGLAAHRQFSPEEFDCVRQFVKKTGLRADRNDAGVALPGAGNARIGFARLAHVLIADPVLLVAPGAGWNLKMDDGGITMQFLLPFDTEFVEEAFVRAGPVSQAIERAAIAKDDCGLVVAQGDGFEAALHMINGFLRFTAVGGRIGARKAAAENDARGFGSDGDVLTEIAARHFENRRLTAAGPSGENDELRLVACFYALAGVRSGGETQFIRVTRSGLAECVGRYDEPMDLSACEECREINRELRNAYEATRRTSAGDAAGNLTEWLAQLDEDECARIRDASPLWKTWRRWQEHRSLTGHAISVLPLLPGAISNPN